MGPVETRSSVRQNQLYQHRVYPEETWRGERSAFQVNTSKTLCKYVQASRQVTLFHRSDLFILASTISLKIGSRENVLDMEIAEILYVRFII